MHHTDEDFLTTIREEPTDRTARLVYADWLEDHGDPRAELIRAEEEMRMLPAFSDNFWMLKLRRNEFRTRTNAEWCGRMGYGTECDPVFMHGLPEGWHERWRLVREFTERWYCIPMPDVGGRQTEIADVEARLEQVLPPSLRELVAFAHDWQHLMKSRYVFGYNYQMRQVLNQPAIALGLLTQAVASAVRHTNLQIPDPPVLHYFQREPCDDDQLNLDPDGESCSPVTVWVLQSAAIHVPASGGSFMAVAQSHHLDMLRESFTVARLDDDVTLFESCNILVKEFRSPWKKGQRAVSVKLFRAIPRSQVPDVILDLAAHRRQGYGSFVDPT
jgi:uncharacterized protein (TIGR02996 family)